MSRPTLSLVTYLWNGEKYGFPWIELIAEGLANCDEVIVSNSIGDEDDTTREMLLAWSMIEPRLRVLIVNRRVQSLEFPEVVNMAIEAAKSEFVLHLDADEAMDLGSQDFWGMFGVGDLRRLLHEGHAVAFPRWDFTGSSTHVTPIFEGEPPVVRLMARDMYPIIRSQGDAMHLDGAAVYVHEPSPIFHYHGLGSEKKWQAKEIAFQKLYADRGMTPDARLEKGWEAWDGPLARARPCTRPHPPRWQPWLARAEMKTRDFLQNPPPKLDTEAPLG